ncbi:hypothetical protein [Mobiluncus mulieris]|nr:hypothetical protein [Mobiluncus mulieris]
MCDDAMNRRVLFRGTIHRPSDVPGGSARRDSSPSIAISIK